MDSRTPRYRGSRPCGRRVRRTLAVHGVSLGRRRRGPGDRPAGLADYLAHLVAGVRLVALVALAGLGRLDDARRRAAGGPVRRPGHRHADRGPLARPERPADQHGAVPQGAARPAGVRLGRDCGPPRCDRPWPRPSRSTSARSSSRGRPTGWAWPPWPWPRRRSSSASRACAGSRRAALPAVRRRPLAAGDPPGRRQAAPRRSRGASRSSWPSPWPRGRVPASARVTYRFDDGETATEALRPVEGGGFRGRIEAVSGRSPSRWPRATTTAGPRREGRGRPAAGRQRRHHPLSRPYTAWPRPPSPRARRSIKAVEGTRRRGLRRRQQAPGRGHPPPRRRPRAGAVTLDPAGRALTAKIEAKQTSRSRSTCSTARGSATARRSATTSASRRTRPRASSSRSRRATAT